MLFYFGKKFSTSESSLQDLVFHSSKVTMVVVSDDFFQNGVVAVADVACFVLFCEMVCS